MIYENSLEFNRQGLRQAEVRRPLEVPVRLRNPLLSHLAQPHLRANQILRVIFAQGWLRMFLGVKMKRFSGTEKWNKPWFRKLPPKLKCFLQYFWDNCDCAGVWTVDMELASLFIGETVTEKEVLSALGERLENLGNGKWLERDFIPFQYGTLSELCKPHKRILAAVSGHKLTNDGKGYTKGTLKGSKTLEEEEEDKEEEKDKDRKGGSKGENGRPEELALTPPPERKPSEEEIAIEIYELYPKKASRPDALTAIRRALKSGVPADLLRERTEAYAKAVVGTGTLIPYPSTWFNGQRYNDGIDSWVRQNGDKPKIVTPDWSEEKGDHF